MTAATICTLLRRLVGISEAMHALNHLPTGRSSLVRTVKLEVQSQCDDNDQSAREHARDDARMVVRLILITEHCAANDATDATGSDQGSGAQSTLPLTTDVVCLPCQNARDVGVASGGCKKDSKVAYSNIVEISEKW